MMGYMHPEYAQSLAEFGDPRELPKCGGWILCRQIPGSSYYDGMGCYPLFVCREWCQLYGEMQDMATNGKLVSLSIVTDPFSAPNESYLRQCFRDVVMPFKEHFVVDLKRGADHNVSQHHHRYARKALREVDVERCSNPVRFIDEWVDLYNGLIVRHTIKGIPAFSKQSFTRQLQVPGIVMFRASYQGVAVGMLLWYCQGEVGYYHLGAFSDLGYALRASFALFWRSIEYFAAEGLRWLNLGAGAGIANDQSDGLTRFKRGWSTEIRTAYFCGHIFHRAAYAEIMQAKGHCLSLSPNSYFPAYRQGEFG